jgi:hypothetical protein
MERRLHGDIVGVEGLTGVQPEETLLASAWGWGGEGSQHCALRRDSGTGGRPEQLINARTSTWVDDGDRRLQGCFSDLAWTRGSGEECSGPRRASPGEERALRERKEKGSMKATGSV